MVVEPGQSGVVMSMDGKLQNLSYLLGMLEVFLAA